MPTSIHVRLLVDDFPACFRFYRDVVGIQPSFGEQDDVYADFAVGDTMLALFKRGLMPGEKGGQPDEPPLSNSHAILVFAVEDVDRELARMSAAGAELVSSPMDRPEWGLRTAHVRDPEGNLVEINQSLTSSHS